MIDNLNTALIWLEEGASDEKVCKENYSILHRLFENWKTKS